MLSVPQISHVLLCPDALQFFASAIRLPSSRSPLPLLNYFLGKSFFKKIMFKNMNKLSFFLFSLLSGNLSQIWTLFHGPIALGTHFH